MSGTTSPHQTNSPLRRLRNRILPKKWAPSSPSASLRISTRPQAPSALLSPSLSLSTPSGSGHSSANPDDLAVRSVQTDPLGQDFLDRVFQRLTPPEQEMMASYKLSPTDDLDRVLQRASEAAQDKQQRCHSSRWTFKFGDHTITLGEKADKLVQWLNRFKKIGDIAVNADPIHAGLPWAGIRLLLEVGATLTLRLVYSLIVLRQPCRSMNKWPLS